MNDIERIVKEVHSSMAMEGLPLTSSDKDRIRKCLTDPGCLDSVIRALLVKHSAKEEQVRAIRYFFGAKSEQMRWIDV